MTTFTDSQLADAVLRATPWKPEDNDLLYAAAARLRGLGEQPAVPREPTQAMIDAGFTEWVDAEYYKTELRPTGVVTEVWRAMYDAATDQSAVPTQVASLHMSASVYEDAATDQPAAVSATSERTASGNSPVANAVQPACVADHPTGADLAGAAADPARDLLLVGNIRRALMPHELEIGDYVRSLLQRALAQIIADGERIEKMRVDSDRRAETAYYEGKRHGAEKALEGSK